jgi:hypothetical protein
MGHQLAGGTLKTENGKRKTASKREQSQICLNYAEHEQIQNRKAGLKVKTES